MQPNHTFPPLPFPSPFLRSHQPLIPRAQSGCNEMLEIHYTVYALIFDMKIFISLSKVVFVFSTFYENVCILGEDLKGGSS